MGHDRLIRRILRHLSFLLVLVSSFVEADPALITPSLREIEFTGPAILVEHGLIVLAGAHPKLQIAATEINHRLTQELFTEPLPARRGSRTGRISAGARLGASPANVGLGWENPVRWGEHCDECRWR